MSYSACAYVQDSIARGARVRHEGNPWLYRRTDRRYSNNAYRLLIFPSGFMQRVYDWECSV